MKRYTIEALVHVDLEADCTNCVYGPEFIDDGVPHRFILDMCAACQESSRKTLDAFIAHRLLQQKPEGQA